MAIDCDALALELRDCVSRADRVGLDNDATNPAPSMSVNLKQLEAFVVVADLRSFRRAAERLNTTQPNISTRIAALEDRLGAILMERDAGSVRLTPKGEALLTHARHVLQSLDSFLLAAQDDALFEGVIRLGVTEMIVHSWLGAFLKALKERFPNIVVEVTVDFSASISTALFNRTLDLAFQSGPFERAATGMITLDSYPMIWAASPDLRVRGRPLTLDDLATHPLLITARGTLPFEQLAAHLANARNSAAKAVPSTNMLASVQMAVDGLGIACLPAAIVQSLIASERLVALDYRWCPDPLRFAARYDAERVPSFVPEAAAMAASIAEAWSPDNEKS